MKSLVTMCNEALSADKLAHEKVSTLDQICKISGARSNIVQKFLDDNKVSDEKLLKALNAKEIDPTKVMSAVAGTPNNEYAKEIQTQFGM